MFQDFLTLQCLVSTKMSHILKLLKAAGGRGGRGRGIQGIQKFRNTCPLNQTSVTFVKIVEKYLWSLPAGNITKNELFHTYLSKNFDRFSKQLFFQNTFLYLLCLLIFTFVEILTIFLASRFSLLKRHQIGLFENAIVYSCMWSTSVNMFSANWGILPYIDKKSKFCGGVGVGSSPTDKDEKYPCTPLPK